MPLLYYWRPDNYLRDLDVGAGFHLNQANPAMHQIGLGDSLWAFTRISCGTYVLAAESVVRGKTINPVNYRYGRYRVWGGLSESRYFATRDAPDIEEIIRSLSCRTNASILGRAFQGAAAVRQLTVEDHQTLSVAAQGLLLEPRARLLPEGRLESALLSDDGREVRELIEEEEHGLSAERRAYLLQSAPTRSRQLVRALRGIYDGRCQICLWDPCGKYAEHLCHSHHIRWLSRGGRPPASRMRAHVVCPNPTMAIHRCDAPFDYQDLAFHFGDSQEVLQVDHHLRNALGKGKDAPAASLAD